MLWWGVPGAGWFFRNWHGVGMATCCPNILSYIYPWATHHNCVTCQLQQVTGEQRMPPELPYLSMQSYTNLSQGLPNLPPTSKIRFCSTEMPLRNWQFMFWSKLPCNFSLVSHYNFLEIAKDKVKETHVTKRKMD